MADRENDKAGHSRRTFLKTGAGAVASLVASRAGAAGGQTAPERPAHRPNILILVGEGVRSDELSFAGNPIIRTPNIDRLGYEGAHFRNTFCTNSICSPGRASILTGLYSHTNGVVDNNNREIPLKIPIFTDLLHQSGYEVSCFGKTHLRHALKNRYWDYYFAFEAARDVFAPVITEGRKGQIGAPKTYHGFADDVLTDHAISWMSEERGKPFCCVFMFQSPHAPFYRARRNLDLYNGVPIPKPITFDDDLKGYPGKPRAFADADNKIGTTILGNDDARSLEEMVKDHYCGVVSNDQNFHRMIEALEKSGKFDDTVILFTSDHGFFLGEWRFYDKRFMHEPSIRIPLLVRYPKFIQAGTVVDKMALNIDLAPTILDLAGVDIPREMQGQSLVPFMKGTQPQSWRKDWLYEYYEYPGNEQVKPNRGVRTEQYKLIHYFLQPEEFELYDLKNDPGELYNLYGDPRYADLTRTLLQRIDELRKETNDHYVYHPVKPVD